MEALVKLTSQKPLSGSPPKDGKMVGTIFLDNQTTRLAYPAYPPPSPIYPHLTPAKIPPGLTKHHEGGGALLISAGVGGVLARVLALIGHLHVADLDGRIFEAAVGETHPVLEAGIREALAILWVEDGNVDPVLSLHGFIDPRHLKDRSVKKNGGRLHSRTRLNTHFLLPVKDTWLNVSGKKLEAQHQILRAQRHLLYPIRLI